MNQLLQKLSDLLVKLSALLGFPDEKVILPPTVNIPPPAPTHLSLIPAWAAAIKIQEGWHQGTRSFSNKNPGNLKYGGYTKMFPHVGTDADNFLIFETEEQGMAALCGFLKNACEDKYFPTYQPQMSLKLFTALYAEPPTSAYVNAIAVALKVEVTTPISQLL